MLHHDMDLLSLLCPKEGETTIEQLGKNSTSL
jgi:hypothetical protein